MRQLRDGLDARRARSSAWAVHPLYAMWGLQCHCRLTRKCKGLDRAASDLPDDSKSQPEWAENEAFQVDRQRQVNKPKGSGFATSLRSGPTAGQALRALM